MKIASVEPIMVVGMMKWSSSGASEGVIANGLISAAIPIDNNGSVILEPIRVPIATPSLFLAAIKAIVNSGSEVPNPEMVEPIVECGIFIDFDKSFAIDTRC